MAYRIAIAPFDVEFSRGDFATHILILENIFSSKVTFTIGNFGQK